MTISARNKISHGILNASRLEILHYVTFLTRPFDQVLICVAAPPLLYCVESKYVAGTGCSRLSIPDFVLQLQRKTGKDSLG